jgi:hypothetical protein
MSACGVWRTPRRLVAVVVNGDGAEASAPVTVPLTEDARWGFAVWLQSKGVVDVVTSDELARSDPIAETALRHGIHVWLAPAAIVEGVRQIAGLTQRPARYTAALLARWRSAPTLRPYLRAAILPASDRQLGLWPAATPSQNRPPPRKVSPERSVRETRRNASRDTPVEGR